MEEDDTPIQASEQLLNYIYSFETPVEVDFFGAKQKEQLDKEDKKLKKTQDYLAAVAANPSLGSQLERDIATGLIYSQGEMDKVEKRHKAMEQFGERVFPDISLVSPTGQRIIMSRHLSDDLGFLTDGYVMPAELEDLELSLKAEGVLDDKVNSVKQAMKVYGAIVVQRGAYESLFDLLDEAAPYDLKKSQFAQKDAEFEEVKNTFEKEEHGASLDALKAAVQIPVPPKATPLEKMNFASELKTELERPELPSAATRVTPPAPIPSVPKPAPHPTVPLADMPKQFVSRQPVKEAHITTGLKNLVEIRTIDDLKKIQTEHLRQGELGAQISLIRSKIFDLARVNKVIPFYAAAAFMESPLYKAYLAIGQEMIADPSPDRAKAFVAASGKHSAEPLTLREFEAIADLRKQIE